MGLRDMLKKKSDVDEHGPHDKFEETNSGPEFTFIRTDTVSQDVIHVPGGHDHRDSSHLSPGASSKAQSTRRSMDMFRSRSRSRASSVSSHTSHHSSSHKDSTGRRLSQRLHLSRQPESSDLVPDNLPDIAPTDPGDKDALESQWEKRATILAGQNELMRTRSVIDRSPVPPVPPLPPSDSLASLRLDDGRGLRPGGGSLSRSPSASTQVSSKAIDANIQEAIRLHEAGDLTNSTRMFGVLADESGTNNALSQVLYGLALRHGWGCDPDPERAVKYLSAAASNAASVEELALQAGMKKGGAAKGELVLAIFELANCFRQGWGIPRDPVAAKQYYETAANLGDTDAMNEVAWCYLEGFGCKKDKYMSAKYYRLAENAGHKTIGNTWIWKEKYDQPGKKK